MNLHQTIIIYILRLKDFRRIYKSIRGPNQSDLGGINDQLDRRGSLFYVSYWPPTVSMGTSNGEPTIANVGKKE